MSIHASRPRLIAITDRSLASVDATLRRFEQVARAARPFTVMFQLRDRELPARERLAFGRELRSLCSAERQWFQVNDRCDLAVLLAADAVHLGEASVSAADARLIVGSETFVTRACHEPDGELENGVDGWLLSPIFVERKGRAALGLEGLAKLAARLAAQRAASSREPVLYALGAVNAPNARSCLESHATGVAAIGAVLSVERVDPLLDALGIGRASRS